MENNLTTASDKEIFIFDLTLHILILFGVLLIMFYLIIEPTMTNDINEMINSPILDLNNRYLFRVKDGPGYYGVSLLDIINLSSGDFTPGDTCKIYHENKCNFYVALHNPEVKKFLLNTRNYHKNNKKDIQKDSYNSSLTVSAIIIFILLLIFTMLSYYSLRYTAKRKFDLKNLIISNVLLFLMIACIEVIFFYNITLKHAPLLPSEIVDYFVKDLEKKL